MYETHYCMSDTGSENKPFARDLWVEAFSASLEKENTLEHGHMFSEVATEGKQLENPTGEFYGPGLEVACVTSAHVPEFLSLICLQKRLEKLTSCAQQAKQWGECTALFLPQCTCLLISLRSSFLSPKMCAFRIQVGDGS